MWTGTAESESWVANKRGGEHSCCVRKPVLCLLVLMVRGRGWRHREICLVLPSFCIRPKVARRGILGMLKPEGWPQGCLETYMQKYACAPPSSSPGSSLLPSGLGRCLRGWHRVLTFPQQMGYSSLSLQQPWAYPTCSFLPTVA